MSRKDKLIVLISALVLRLTILLIMGFQTNWNGTSFLNNDSFSYIGSFENFIVNGKYMFDLAIEDSRYGRTVGYPLFYGFFYLLNPTYSIWLTILAQIFLDSIASLLLLQIVSKLNTNSRIYSLVGFAAIANPFTIYWALVIGTESLGYFITVLIFSILTCLKEDYRKYIYLGIAVGIAFHIRPYLAILGVSIALFIVLRHTFRKAIHYSFILFTAFMVVYIPWPIRNYILSQKIILVAPVSAGYYRYSPDIMSIRKWAYLWTNDFDNLMDNYLLNPNEIVLPQNSYFSQNETNKIKQYISLGRECGQGINYWMNGKVIENPCDSVVAQFFNQEYASFRINYPLTAYFKVPSLNIYKYFFKLSSKENAYGIVEILIFLVRSAVIIIGLLYLLFSLKSNKAIKVAFLFFFFAQLFLIACYFRQMEMRYMFQAESVLILGFLLFLTRFDRFRH